ncbi:MAG: hypothetical protein P0Y64_18115 [Candidatus Sphingomonas colombiensis]|nr:hypothetical protein [Sphingomonas sp.]WEK43213.1 MAG: hypothetical protein P0Y64_18115 [Sphingomonas sp.]
MTNQHARWLKIVGRLNPPLNTQLPRPVRLREYNATCYWDPGSIDHVVHEKMDRVQIYLLPDINCPLRMIDHRMGTSHKIDPVLASKKAQPHCATSTDIWRRTGSEDMHDVAECFRCR